MGHPVRTLFLENRAVETLLEKVMEEKLNKFLKDGDIDAYKALVAGLDKLQRICIHYKKKGDLFFPHMKNMDLPLLIRLCGALTMR